jgi:transposase
MVEVVRRYRSGETQETIAASLGVSQKAVRRVLDRLEEPRRTSCPVSGVHRQTILDWHAEGKSIKVISAQLGLNFATVYQVLRRAGRVQKKRR